MLTPTAMGKLWTLKQMCRAFGKRIPKSVLQNLQILVDNVHFGHWQTEMGFKFTNLVNTREAVFEAVAKHVANERVLYLEFGVFQGASMRYWSKALKSPEARLYGFDSFEGLPDDWTPEHGKGAFNVNGSIPVIDDARIKFHKGWFDQTLPGFVLPPHDRLVAVMDADLYGSTIFALRQIASAFRPGSFLYFDDLYYPHHDPRAFRDFVRETGLRFRPVCADKVVNRAFFECIA
jgi:hypothetical protein